MTLHTCKTDHLSVSRTVTPRIGRYRYFPILIPHRYIGLSQQLIPSQSISDHRQVRYFICYHIKIRYRCDIYGEVTKAFYVTSLLLYISFILPFFKILGLCYFIYKQYLKIKKRRNCLKGKQPNGIRQISKT